MRINRQAMAGLVALLAAAVGCRGAPDGAARAAAPLSFGPPIFLEDSAETTANASLGDLDGDGDTDIVLAKGRHWPLLDLVLLNDGQGRFAQRHAVGDVADRTYTAALADLDGDGDLDLAMGNDKPDQKRIYHNDGTGRFAVAGTFGSASWSTRNITIAELNADDRPDIIVANRGGPKNLSNNYICLNDGAGKFPLCTVLSSESATTIAAADLDGNGTIDLVVPHRDEGQSYVFLNNGSAGFDVKLPFGRPDAATRAVAAGDLTGDGLPELIVGSDEGGALVFVNLGGGVFAEPVSIGASSDEVYAIAVADLDGDGVNDVVLGNDGQPGVVLINGGDGRRFSRTVFGDGDGAVYGLAVGDVNDDACPDIVAARSGARSVLYLNSCGKPDN